MQYFEQDDQVELYCTLREQLESGEDNVLVSLTNDLSQVNKKFAPAEWQQGERHDTLVFQLVDDVADEDLENGDVFFQPTGSYTYAIYVRNNDDFPITDDNIGRIIERGKAIIYPNGAFSTAHKFGNEVTYTEHTNPTTNTIYIQE